MLIIDRHFSCMSQCCISLWISQQMCSSYAPRYRQLLCSCTLASQRPGPVPTCLLLPFYLRPPRAALLCSALQALGLATVLGTALAAALLLWSDGALALMGAGPETGHVHELALEFLTIRCVLVACMTACALAAMCVTGLRWLRQWP